MSFLLDFYEFAKNIILYHQSARKIETLPKKDRTKLELEIANLVLNDLLKGKGRSYMILKRKSFTQ